MYRCEYVFHDGSREQVWANGYKIKWADPEKTRELSYVLMQGMKTVREIPVDWIKKPDWLTVLKKVEDE